MQQTSTIDCPPLPRVSPNSKNIRGKIIRVCACLQADIWSFGVSMFQLCSGLPYEPPPKGCADPAGFMERQIACKQLDFLRFPSDMGEFLAVHTLLWAALWTCEALMRKASKQYFWVSPMHCSASSYCNPSLGNRFWRLLTWWSCTGQAISICHTLKVRALSKFCTTLKKVYCTISCPLAMLWC